MKEEKEKPAITAFVCGPQCKDGGEHDWSGPTIELERGASVSCAKCGALAIDVSLWELP
jgi:hypothetical protein